MEWKDGTAKAEVLEGWIALDVVGGTQESVVTVDVVAESVLGDVVMEARAVVSESDTVIVTVTGGGGATVTVTITWGASAGV